jgi:hypothetical protein
MHDGQLEDQLRRVLRAEGDALSVTITPDKLERRLAVRRRMARGRSLGIVAAGIAAALLVSLVVTSSSWLTQPRLGSADSPAATESDSPTGTPSTPPSTDQLPALPRPEGTVLVEATSGTRGTSTAVLDPIDPRAQYQVDVVCRGSGTLRWSLGFEGHLDFLAAGDQGCGETPGRYVVERGIPTTDLPVIVTADESAEWHIVVSTVAEAPTFIPPAVRMIETGNTEGSAGAVEAFGLCVSTAEGSDPCTGQWSALDAARSILVPTNGRVTLGLEDAWRIDEARITAAPRGLVAAGSFAPEHSVAFVEQGGPLVTVPIPLEPGPWILRVAVNGSRGSEAFSAHYDMVLDMANERGAAVVPVVEGSTGGDILLLDPPTGTCMEGLNVLQIGFDLEAADAAIDALGGAEGWIDSPLSDGRPGRSFHGGLQAAAFAHGGVRLAIGGDAPWILQADGTALELRSSTTPKGRTIWQTGDHTRRVPCPEDAVAQ